MTRVKTVKQPRTRRQKILRFSLWTFGILLLIPVLLWIGGAAYVYTHREKLLKEVLVQLNKGLGGELRVSGMEPTLLGDFPNVSIALHDVTLRDSLWNIHHRDLLSMKRVYVKVSPLSIMSDDGLVVRQVRLADGSFDLFTDTTGYSNGYLLKSKNPDTTSGSRREGPSIERALLENVRFTMEDLPKDKAFRLHIRSLRLDTEDKGEVEALNVKTEIYITGLGFNLSRGSFAKNKTLNTTLDVNFNTRTRTIDIPMQEMDFNGDEINIAARFYIGPENKWYQIHISVPEIRVDSGASFLAENVTPKINLVSMRDPVAVDARIGGYFKERNPKVHATFNAEDNVLVTPAGEFTECSFAGFYDNEVVKGRDRTDPNSVIEIDAFKGTYKGIPINADTIAITDLRAPKLLAVIRSKFNATDVNNITGGKTFRLSGGAADFNLRYFGSLSLIDNIVPSLQGAVNIRNAEGVYVPRNLPLSGINAQIVFRGVDVQFPRVAFRTGSSNIVMSGMAQNLMGAMHQPTVPARLQWSVTSPLIDLSDFLPFLQTRGGASSGSAPAQSNTTASSTPVADRLDDVLDRADAHLTTNIARVQYKKFRADAVQATVLLTRTHVQLQRAALRHAGGTIQISGEAEQGSAGNNFAMKAAVKDVNVTQIFTTFDNFGQDALQAENIRGVVTFDADMRGKLDAKGGLVPHSMVGNLEFNVRQGALVSFAPLEKVGKYIFRRRNLSDLRFEVLKATFHLANDKIEIEPMEVRSSALSLNLVGTYGLEKGTDISFQVPLRNPKKDSLDLVRDAAFETGDRGLVFHLRAQNPTGKDLNISWDRGGKGYRARMEGKQPEAATADEDPQPAEQSKRKRLWRKK